MMTATPTTAPSRRHRPGRILVRAVLFLAVFAVVLLAVTQLYLFPALRAAGKADPAERRQLAAHATLMLAVVLFVLFAGLVLTFRIGRYFFPKPPVARREPTQYVDAWAEAGRRATPADMDDEG